MLVKLAVKNYALIADLEVDFNSGYNVITGETGSGKSLLLGALGLLLGQNADFSKIANPALKCISEGYFSIANYNLQPFFQKNDLDYEPLTVVRRELNNSGKSRAFINDTPVKLALLKEFTSELIDIHSQHENSKIHSKKFLFDVLDAFSGASDILKEYRAQWTIFKSLEKELAELEEKEAQLKMDRDYFEFQLNELKNLSLEELNMEELESEMNILEQADEIKSKLHFSSSVLSSSEENVINGIKQAEDFIKTISRPDNEILELLERVTNAKLELEDISYELHKKSESISPDQSRLEKITDTVNEINSLLVKHRSNSIDQLIEKRVFFQSKVEQADNYDSLINELKNKLQIASNSLNKLTNDLTKLRLKNKIKLESYINKRLAELSMSDAEFQVSIQPGPLFTEFGKDELQFLIRSNKGVSFREISKVASGGEISRIMFLIKSAMASKKSIKTLILDEIDTGISGEVASKLATQLKQMSSSSQLLVVTHLAQIASKANSHYKVSKNSTGNMTKTELKPLNTKAEILNELASILSGEKVTEAALQNAASLLSEH